MNPFVQAPAPTSSARSSDQARPARRPRAGIVTDLPQVGLARDPDQRPEAVEALPPVDRSTTSSPTSASRPRRSTAGETDSFDPSRPAIEVYGKVKPIDIAGDIVSHYLARGVDPHLTAYYKQFQQSLTPQQHQFLRQKYVNEGAKSPYGQWLAMSALPSFFRGYAFKQWPNSNALYTQSQRRMFDQMMTYLRGK
jgi:hypothetical protein